MSLNNQNIHEGGWLKPILKHGKWYLLSSFLTKGLSFFMLPVYTSYLDPEDYGLLSGLNSVARLLPIFISLSLDAAFSRFFHDIKHDQQKLKEMFSTIYWFVSLYGVFIIILSLFTAKFWINDLLSVETYPYAYLAFIPPLFMQLGTLGMTFLRQSLLAKQTSILEISAALINIAVAVSLLVGLNLNIIALLCGGAASAFFLFIFNTVYFIKKGVLKPLFKKTILISSLIYSIPLIPSVAGNWIAGLSDRLVIAKYVDLNSVGLYSLGFNIAIILYVLHDAITQVLSPITMSGMIHDKERIKKKMADFSLFLWAFMLFASLGLFLFSKDIVTIFAEKSYAEAYKVIPIIGFVYVIGAQQRFFITIISFHKKTWIISSAAIIAAIFNLGLNLIFVPVYGYMAAPVATVISFLSYNLWLFFWCQKLDRINFYWKNNIFVFLIYICSLIIGYKFLFAENISINLFLIKISLFVVVGIIITFISNVNFIRKFILESLKKEKK